MPNLIGLFPRNMYKTHHIVFLGDLEVQADREVCLGAADYAADHPGWDFDPWPISQFQSRIPTPNDLRLVDGILTSETAYARVFGSGRSRIPKVFFLADSAHLDTPCVSLDEVAIAKMAAEHLWLRGYRLFAFVGPEVFSWSQKRGKGFADAITQLGATVRSHLFSQAILPSFWSWGTAQRSHHLHQMLAGLDKPCGIFAANDVIAFFIIQAARQVGYRVPEDIGLVGVDDDPVPNAAARLGISSVHIPFHEVGCNAAQALDIVISRGVMPPESPRMLPVRVVVRTSTDVFMTEDPLVRKAQHFIELHRNERVLVQEVVRAVGSNRVTLGKRFCRYLGATLVEYIRKRRIEHAKELLSSGAMNVGEVSLRCGFSSTSHFTQVFKTVMGITPGRMKSRRAG